MRKSALAALVSVAAATGCTSILGDFTSTDTITGSDATTEGGTVTSEAGGSNDGTVATGDSGDGGVGAGDSGEAGLAKAGLLACAEMPGSRQNLTGNLPSSALQPYGMMSMFNAPALGGGGSLYIVAAANNALHALTVPQNGGSVGVTDTVLNLSAQGNTNVFDIERYPGGFAVLVQNVNSNGPYLAIERIADGAAAWSAEYVVSIANPTNPLPNSQVSASLAVVDSSTNEFYISIYDQETGLDGGPADVLRWQHVIPGASPGNLPHVPDLPSGFRLIDPDFAYDSRESYVLMQPASQNGTPGPNSLLYQISPMGFGPGQVAPTQQLLMPPAASTLFALGMTNSVLNQGSANLAFLEGNLNSGVLSYYVGQVPTSGANNLGSFTYTNLTQTSPGVGDGGYTVADLPTNHAAIHWEAFPSPAIVTSENLLAVSVLDSTQGVNFIWWDAITGDMRASRTGVLSLLSGLDGLTGVSGIQYANATFAGAPTNVTTTVLLAYSALSPDAGGGGSNNNTGPEDIWLVQVGCHL